MREAALPLAMVLCASVPAAARAQTPAGATRAEPITLQAAVERALARNPNVTAAITEVRRSEALLREARAATFPTATGNATYTHLDHERRLMDRIVAGQDQVAANVQVTVPLLAPQGWGQNWAARDNVIIAGTSAQDVRRQVALATARAYLAVVAQHRVIEANESARQTAKAHYDYAHTRLMGGLGRSIDEVRAGQQLSTSEAQVQQSYAGLARAEEALGVLVGASGPVDSLGDPVLPLPPTLAAALEGARGGRSDVKLQEQRVEAADHRRNETWTYYAPYLAVVGQPFTQKPASLVQPTLGWQAQLILALPIYDGGLRTGVAQERDALAAEARINLEGTRRQAESEVRSSFEVMLRADSALAAARDAARLAASAVKLSTTAYQAGATSNLEVIDAERQARDAEITAAVAEDASRQARLELLVASGRFP